MRELNMKTCDLTFLFHLDETEEGGVAEAAAVSLGCGLMLRKSRHVPKQRMTAHHTSNATSHATRRASHATCSAGAAPPFVLQCRAIQQLWPGSSGVISKSASAAAATAHFDFLDADFTIMVVIESPGKASYVSRAAHPPSQACVFMSKCVLRVTRPVVMPHLTTAATSA